MNPIRFAINKPVTVAVGVILVLLFGVIGITRLPKQMTPDVTEPKITVTTLWPGASPYEVEKDVVEEQEKVLKGIRGLEVLESSSYNDMAEVTLTFQVGTDLDAALLRVSNKLNEVPRYPDGVERPVIDPSAASASPVIWMMLKSTAGDPKRVLQYRTFFENDVRQYLERVPGVGSLLVFGGSDKQLEVMVSMQGLARYNIPLGRVMDRLSTANANISAGTLGVDKKNYRVRTVAEFQTPDEPLRVVLKDDGIHRVHLKDVAATRFGYAPVTAAVMHNGAPGIVVGVINRQGANVVELTNAMRKVVGRVNEEILAPENLRLEWLYDQNPYIQRAIGLVVNNVLIGSFLAVCVLLLFLRRVSSTAAVAVAIPISAVGTFVFMWTFHRSLNVVSLAGISFAVGMLVDNAIVVLENIDRHRNMGKSAFDAAHDGAREVWGAVLASTATTVAVFLPVIFMKQEAGLLFKDIAIAITFAIVISLVVSTSVIPSMANQTYRLSGKKKRMQSIGRMGSAVGEGLIRLSALSLSNWATRLFTIVGLVAVSVLAVWVLLPKAEYLPQGNRNLVLNILLPPPGYSLEKRWDMGGKIWERLSPYFSDDYTWDPEKNPQAPPPMKDLFYVGADRITLFGVIGREET
ncbi:MAG: efflux RND transporter permease subunit, partial [Deltaproteobacteria bacterium]|nr:efflux RND transporter permease subunit [Deltaproteobacteria bacterium]